MKKKLTHVYAVFWALLIFVLFVANVGNPPNGYTGAPPTFNTCSFCHSGGTGTGNVVITGLPGTIMPGTPYPITVTVNRTNTVPQLGGFQMVVLDATNNNAGTLSTPGPNSTIQTEAGKTYFEHNPAVAFGGNNSINYTVIWTSPASGSGTITMYAAANLANQDGNTSGDNIVTTTASGTLGGGGGAITVTTTSTNVSCFGGNNGSATANASGGGGGPYSYNWSNGATTQTAGNLVAGTYTVTVTNAAGGNGTASVTITQPPQLTVSILNQININCFIPLGTATAQGAGGTGGFTYNWSSGVSGATASNLPPGISTVTVTDGNGCTATTTVNITANTTPPTAIAGPPGQLDCANPTVSLNGAGSSTGPNFTYLWTTSNGQIISGATTLTPLVGASGSYTLTVTNTSNGCTASSSTTVTSNFTPPVSNAGPDDVITCAAPQVMLNGTASSTGANIGYLWTTTNGNIVSGANTPTPTVNAAGTYCLLVTNTANGCTASDCANVTANTTSPIANVASPSPITCTVTTITLDGSASSSGANIAYLWSTANGNIVSGATTNMAVVDAAGTYTLTVTNTTNGCTAQATAVVTANVSPPTANAGPPMTLNCNNAVVVLNGSGSSQGANFTYTWAGPGIQSGGNTVNPTVNAPGTYTITVTNTATGCTASSSTSVVQTPDLTAAIAAQTNVDCNGNNTGSATAEGNGGNGDYAYSWSNGGTTAQISNLVVGIYTVTVTDDDGCTATATANITQPPLLTANASATGETSVGANDGTATANPQGGVPGYTYAWSNGTTTQTITDLPAGNYTVTVTDANGCVSVQTVTVSSFSCAGFNLGFSSENPSCQGSMDGSITAEPAGGTPTYSFLWSNGGTTATISGLGAGSFTVTVTDDNNCEATGNVTLAAPPALNLSIAQQTNVSCNGGANGSATIAAAGGVPGYVFDWSNGEQGASQSGLPAGTYSVTATDENGCTATIQVGISQPTALSGTVTATGETSVGANDGTATANISGGVAPYIYVWDNGATEPTATNLPPGEHCVTVTDANGCVFSGCATVSQFGCVGTTIVAGSSDATCHGSNDGTATVIFTGFEPPVAVLWSNGGTGATIGGLTAGTYSVTVTGADGCTGEASTTVGQPAELLVVLLDQTDIACEGQANGSIAVNGQGGVPGYVFNWSNGSTAPTITGLPAGDYAVTLTDAANCTATFSTVVGVIPDTMPPTVFTAGPIISLGMDGTASITAEMVDGGSFDNCGIDTMFLDVYDFTCVDAGANTVTLTVVDNAGNVGTASTTLFVVDEIAPIILCPPTITVVGDVCEAIVEYDPPTAFDNCNSTNVFLLAGLPSGALFPAGTTDITWGADDGNGNATFCTFSVTVASNLTAEVVVEEPSCADSADGTATAFPSGGIPPYSFEWTNPVNQFTQTATGLAAGTYTVFVTDSQGCVSSVSVEVTAPAEVTISLDQITDETGNNMNGSISITASGGSGGYLYDWLIDGLLFSNEEDLAGLSAGTYQLVVTDQNGCTASSTFVVDRLTSTFEPALATRIVLWPNPVSDLLQVKFDLPRPSNVHIEVYDFTGRSVLPATRAMLMDETVALDLSAVSAGMYFVRFVVDEFVVVKYVVVGR